MMFLSPDQLWGFLLAAVVLTLTPGPDNLMVLSLGMSKGRRLGMAFGLGCALGCVSHTLLAALGVGALIAASPTAFGGLKMAGALYLFYMAWNAWQSRGVASLPDSNAAAARAMPWFFKGLLANAINPKVVVFFLALLPQFVQAERGMEAQQMLELGLWFTLQAAVLFVSLGWFAGHIGAWLSRRPQAGVWLDRLAALVMAGLGWRLLLSE